MVNIHVQIQIYFHDLQSAVTVLVLIFCSLRLKWLLLSTLL